MVLYTYTINGRLFVLRRRSIDEVFRGRGQNLVKGGGFGRRAVSLFWFLTSLVSRTKSLGETQPFARL